MGGSQLFENSIVNNLRQTFDISKDDSIAFKYIGIDLEQNSEKSVNINQASNVRSVNPIIIESSVKLDKNDPVTKEEKRQLRGAIGQMNWISGISRPDISFNVCES